MKSILSKHHLNPYRLCFSSALLLIVAVHFVFPDLWSYTIGLFHYDKPTLYPFLDMHGRLAAFEAWKQGFDVWSSPNPLDPLHRFNGKPSWGLAISALGMTRDHLLLAGGIVVSSTLAIVVGLIRPRDVKEVILGLLLVCSPGIMLGIERANDDLVYFSLLALVPLLLKDGRSHQRVWGTWLLIFLIAPAKYYPGAAFSVFLIEANNAKQFWRLLLAGVLFMAFYLGLFWDEVVLLSGAVPKPDIIMASGLGIVMDNYLGSLWLQLVLLFSVFLAVVWGLFYAGRLDELAMDLWKKQYFIIGYSVYLFCYLLNSNFDYRFIFLLFTVPALYDLAFRQRGGHFVASVARIMLLFLVVMFWVDILGFHALTRVFSGKDVLYGIKAITMVKNLLVILVIGFYSLLAIRMVGPSFSICCPFLNHIWSKRRKEFYGLD